MSQISNLLLSKRALGQLDEELVLLDDVKHLFQQSQVVFHGLGVNQYGIHEDQYTFSEESGKNLIHDALKGGWRIC